MGDDLRSQIMAANDQYARNGLRVLAVAATLDPPGLAAASQPEQLYSRPG